MRWLYNYIKARPAVARHRNGTEQSVSVLTREASGNYYCFEYPYRPHDHGFSVPPRYLRYTSPVGGVYVWVAGFAVRALPGWVSF